MPHDEHLQLGGRRGAFVDRFTAASRTSPTWEALLAPLGSGKVLIASAVVARVMSDGAQSALVLSNDETTASTIAARSSATVSQPPPLIELNTDFVSLRPWAEGLLWPERFIAHGWLPRVARAPVDYSVRARPWDVVIIDVAGARGIPAGTLDWLLDVVEASSLLVLGDDALRHDWPSGLNRLSTTDWTDADWRPERIGRFDVTPQHRTAAELELIETAQAIADRFPHAQITASWDISAAAAASAPALVARIPRIEAEVRHHRNRIAHGLPLREGEGPGDPTLLPVLERLAADLAELSDAADDLGDDSRWIALKSALRGLDPDRTAVFCAAGQTAAYVRAQLSQAGWANRSPLSADLARRSDETSGGVTVSADVELKGVDLRWIDTAINFDLPTAPEWAYIRWSRLDWSRDPSPVMTTIVDLEHLSEVERRSVERTPWLLPSPLPTV